MNVKALVIEQLDHDGYLRTFEMLAEPGKHITVAFADERENPRSGPFHFLDKRLEAELQNGLAECTAGKLAKSQFVVGEETTVLKHSWANIPTQRNSLSYYALSLPEFAVPTLIEFKDPHSGRRYSCTVVRDDQKSRFVAYLGCRSSHGSFDFLLQANYEIDRAGFRNRDYKDEYTTPRNARIPRMEDVLTPDLNTVVTRFFSALHTSAPVPALGTPVRAEAPNQRTVSAAAESNGTDRLPQKKTDLSEYLDGACLTDIQREVISLRLEYALPVAAIARRLGRDRKTIQEHLAAAKKRIDHARAFQDRLAKKSHDSQ